ncbi:MAG: condensation domain-containing protein, partial [Burkholderiales bacterium]
MQDRFDLRGAVDQNLFRRAWQSIVNRHDALRTSFLWEISTRPCQVVHRRVELSFEYHDWRTLPDAEARLEALLAEERRRGFDFLKPPLMTVRLFRLGEDRYRFVRSFHHILIDAWCLSPMLVELRDSYQALCRGETPDFGPAPQFRRYIAWLQGRDDQSAEQFWRNNLQGFAEATPCNVDNRAAAGTERGVGDTIAFLSEQETVKLNALAQRCRLTPNTFVQAAWALMLSRYSGRAEVLFGVTVSGRPAELPGSERMLGVFINTLPLRVSVAVHQSLPEFLQGLFARNLEIRQYEHAPLGRIQCWSEIPRERPLFESLLVFENYPVDPGLRTGQGAFGITGVETRTHTNYPLTGMAIPGDRLHLQITYYHDRFSGAVVEDMLGHFRNLLVEMIRFPEKRLDQFEMLGEQERRRILVDWNRTEPGKLDAVDLPALFEAQVSHTPDAVAAVCGIDRISFRDLNT